MAKIATLLVIDDEVAVLKQLELILKERGYGVLTSSNAAKALALLDSGDPAVDVILTDLVMPRVDGLDVLRYVQEHELDIPIIVLTAFSARDLVTKALRLGAYDFLIKPFKVETMLAAVARACERQHLRAEAAEREELTTALELAGAVAHELNQPLMTIMGIANLLLAERGQSSLLSRNLKIICRAVSEMAITVKQVVELPTQYNALVAK